VPADAPHNLPGVVGAELYASHMSDDEPVARRAEGGEPHAHSSRPALSPSRASDFKQCPLLYRFRAIDRLPEPTSAAQLRGSVVHAALEQLYALPAADRRPETAVTLVAPAWDRVVAAEPELASSVAPELRAALLDEARALLSGYYRLEDPTRFDPQSCEQRVEVELSDGTLLRGFIDRIDVAATGELRVVDYKTGKAPPAARELAEFKAMFQMKFYAVALLRSRGVLPTRLRLLYLADGEILDYSPGLDELLRFEKTLIAIWRAIQSAGATGDFRPSPSRLCEWCAHQSRCPAFGGTPPPYPGWPEELQEGGEDTVLSAGPGAESAA
jgi:putative RecB family exonuclease